MILLDKISFIFAKDRHLLQIWLKWCQELMLGVITSYLIRRKTEQRAKAEVSEAGLERRWRQKAASALTIMWRYAWKPVAVFATL